MSTVHEDQYTYSIIPHNFFLRMRNIWNKSCTENQNTHFVLSNFFLKNRVVYEIILKKYCTAGQATDESTAHAHCMLGT
jgi:hypothetical protein